MCYIWPAEQWNDYHCGCLIQQKVFPLCSSDFSDIILGIALCICSGQDCNVKYKWTINMWIKSADTYQRIHSNSIGSSPSPYLWEGQAQPPVALHWKNATVLGKFLSEVTHGRNIHQSGELLKMGTVEQLVFEKASLATDEGKFCPQELLEGCGRLGWLHSSSVCCDR